LVPSLALAQQSFVKDFWLNESNSPVKVNAIIQDSTGYIWLGTDAGVFRFNGRTFIHISDSVNKPVTAIACSKNMIYVGYVNGQIAEIENYTKAMVVKIRNVTPHSTIRHLALYKNFLLACTEEGVFAVSAGVGIVLNNVSGLSDNFTYSLCFSQDGKMFVGTDKGISVINLSVEKIGVNRVFIESKDELADNIVRVIEPAYDKNSFWIGTQNGGISQLRLSIDSNYSFIKSNMSWRWGQVNDIFSLTKDTAWAVTDNGYLLNLVIHNDTIVTKAYYTGKNLKKILLDRCGNIWCATNEGITMFTIRYISLLKPGDLYSLHELTAMTCDKNDNLWFAENKELYRIALNDTFNNPEKVLCSSYSISSLCSGKPDEIWVGTFGKGLWCLRGNKLTPVTNIETLNNASVLSISCNGDHLWVSSLNGVEEMRITDNSKNIVQLIKHHNKQSGIGSDYVYQLYTDRSGRVWIATDGAGICMYDGSGYHHWDSSSGFTAKVVYSITEGADSTIWAGALDKGIFFYDGIGRWHFSHKKNGLQDINISALGANSTNQLIVVEQNGIDEWYPSSHEFRHFNKRILDGIDSTSNIPNNIARDTSGRVYVPSSKGFLVFDNQYHDYSINPLAHINAVSVFLMPKVGLPATFNYSENYITITFDGINFVNSDQVHYRYLLEGYNNKWIYTDDESVTFPKLSSGNYRFKVQASLNKTFYGKEASYTFTITTPFWLEKWFYTLILVVVILLIYGYTVLREKQLTKVARLQEERMIYEYEHLKSQVNPHFLFNSLNTLTGLIEEDKLAAVDYTTQLADLYRHMLAYRDKNLVLLSEEWEILKGYMYIQQSRFGQALCMDVNIPAELFNTKKVIPLSLQIVVENAIKHNIISLSSPFTITINANNEEIIISNPLRQKISKEKSSGLGLSNISRRYALLSKKEVFYGIINDEFVVKLPLL
jgi:ligand-binding sensor domain-containing protein